MSRYSDAIAKAKAAARQTGRGLVSYGKEVHHYLTEPVPATPPRQKRSTGKIPRWQQFARNLEHVAGSVDPGFGVDVGIGPAPRRRKKRK